MAGEPQLRRWPVLPASFWLAALDGAHAVPVPAVTEEDLPRLATSLPQVVAQAPRLRAIVEGMGQDYRAAMREDLS